MLKNYSRLISNPPSIHWFQSLLPYFIKTLNGLGPSHAANALISYFTARRLWLSAAGLLKVPSKSWKKIGASAFSSTAQSSGTHVPISEKPAHKMYFFNELKTHPFNLVFTWLHCIPLLFLFAFNMLFCFLETFYLCFIQLSSITLFSVSTLPFFWYWSMEKSKQINSKWPQGFLKSFSEVPWWCKSWFRVEPRFRKTWLYHRGVKGKQSSMGMGWWIVRRKIDN